MPKFDGPVPGQSLTAEPKNHPWERPPETADPDEAIAHHLTRIGTPGVMDKILDAVDMGFPVSMVTQTMLQGGVMNGIHTIDISMMIAPVVHDYIVNVLEEEGVEFKEFFEDNKDEDLKKTMSVSKAIQDIKENPESMDDDDDMEDEEEEEEMEEEMPEEAPKRGLMAREEV